MLRMMLKSKIHKATVTEANLDYQGSITIDEVLMRKADLLPGEKVEVFNLNTGSRFATYVIKGKKNSGRVCVNGAAVHLCSIGDKVIIVAYLLVEERKARLLKPKIVHVDAKNRIRD
jgi:aspartate 1-decarboxylase